MTGRKERDVWQYGDFQTPPELAEKVCARLKLMGIEPSAILEPACGRGSFLVAASTAFPNARDILGMDINDSYVAEARKACGGRAEVEQGDFFQTDWQRMLDRQTGRWLVLGNPPWVTNADLGVLKSTNLPVKSNFHGHRGLDALTGRANFDISEWMLLQQVGWLTRRSGWIVMLVKTAVARKVLRRIWKTGEPVGRAAIFSVDAMRHFGAAVDACLFVLPVAPGEGSRDCDVFDSLEAPEPGGTIGYHQDVLVSDDVAKGRSRTDRLMIVPQHELGEDTSRIEQDAPMTWSYLRAHGERIDRRGSVIYRGKPRFSIFGVGAYTFAPWKVAVSGFYKAVCFVKIGPTEVGPGEQMLLSF